MSANQRLFFNSQDCCHFPFCQPNEHCVYSVSASGLNKSFYSPLTLLKWLLKLPIICSLWVFHTLLSHDSCTFPFFLPSKAKARLPLCNPTICSLLKIFPFWSLLLFTSTQPALEQQIWRQCVPSPSTAEIIACLIEGDDVMLAALFKANKNTSCPSGCCFWSSSLAGIKKWVKIQQCAHTMPKSTAKSF